jgi:hypothetical protein
MQYCRPWRDEKNKKPIRDILLDAHCFLFDAHGAQGYTESMRITKAALRFVRGTVVGAIIMFSSSPAHAAVRIWQSVYRGNAGTFDWAHAMSLDTSGQRLYVAGKVANAPNSSDLWINGYNSQTGAQAWSIPLDEKLSNAPIVASSLPGFAQTEELGAGVASWSQGGLAIAGRYYSALSPIGWASNRAAVSYSGSAIASDDIPGTVTATGFAPPSRGLATIIRPTFQTAWTVSLASSSLYSVYYSFAEHDANGNKISELFFPVLTSIDPNWTGDCCYDPPSRLSADAAGNLYALLGSRYTSYTGYDFLFGRLSTAGSLTVWHYDGAGHGTDVADALVASPAGLIFIVAKTSETGTNFSTNLLAFDGSGGLLWKASLAPMRDCALALSPDGMLWVTESATGRSQVYNQAGLLIRSDSLPLPSAGSTYIGQILADASENIYASGASNDEIWIAKYNTQAILPANAVCSLGAYNFPNPLSYSNTANNSATTIRYNLPEASDVTVTISDNLGGMVRFWNFPAGEAGGTIGVNQFTWDGRGMGGGKILTGMYTALVTTKTPPCHQLVRIGVVH